MNRNADGARAIESTRIAAWENALASGRDRATVSAKAWPLENCLQSGGNSKLQRTTRRAGEVGKRDKWEKLKLALK